ncbi:OLC1v1013368C1 [Oldenlandia corymbosa var. corymbosa]|uniref:OLC1v1013368C1 n=1 Tax=Oldenlandia corymbosa var. corymbosa TaxID=529605 RepID=A0AAV1DY41_OLDCO|nr:OLC1v1013368C1 [Oldenlandia corymbosa var. corymbosa]
MSDSRGKLTSQVEVKTNADVFHELLRSKPHQLSTISPNNIQDCNLHDGDWGTVGSVISVNYTHDGKECVSKDIIEAIDEEKKLVKFKVIEGDLLELYKNISVTAHVETNGETNLVTWTIEYEKLHEGIPDPNTLMDLCLQLTKDIESHHLRSNEISGQEANTKKMVSSIEIKVHGDVFHEIYKERPHEISGICPYIHGVDLHEGDWGKEGTVLSWRYTHDGKERVLKDIVEAIDEANKSVTFRVFEGDIMDLYKTFVITLHVDTLGERNLVTWTLEYEKLNESIPDPHSFMELLLQEIKDIESHHLK